jgi:hypothetical protein
MDAERSTTSADQVDKITGLRNDTEDGSGEKEVGEERRPNLHSNHIPQGFKTRARQSGAHRD